MILNKEQIQDIFTRFRNAKGIYTKLVGDGSYCNVNIGYLVRSEIDNSENNVCIDFAFIPDMLFSRKAGQYVYKYKTFKEIKAIACERLNVRSIDSKNLLECKDRDEAVELLRQKFISATNRFIEAVNDMVYTDEKKTVRLVDDRIVKKHFLKFSDYAFVIENKRNSIINDVIPAFVDSIYKYYRNDVTHIKILK